MFIKYVLFLGLGHAMWRDGSSGGVIRICAITEKGAERKVFVGDQVPQYYPKWKLYT